jgi:hypothetical protein
VAAETVLAAGGSAWGGLAAGLIATAVFVVFSGWVILQRVRNGRKDSDG